MSNVKLNQEEWKPCPYSPFGKEYAVSSWGRIMRYAPGTKTCASRYKVGQYLKLSNTHTYFRLRINTDGLVKGVSISRMVLLAFIGEDADPERNQCNHKDGDKTNNNLSNLEWMTCGENIAHAREVLGIFGNQRRGIN